MRPEHAPAVRPHSRRHPASDAPPGVGLAVALVMYAAWAINLASLLGTPPEELGAWVLVALPLQVFLSTGLFITAHDAIHRTVSRSPWVNTAVGWICTLSFAMFSFRHLRTAHHQHHAHPGTPLDPDHHDGERRDPVSWFKTFMGRYLTIWHFVLWIPATWLGLYFIFEVHPINLLLFWPTPALLSAVQLFVFGTWLPHREPAGGHTNPHRAQSLPLGEGLSLLTCFHFGYHVEHHEHPSVPWWRLPLTRDTSNQLRTPTTRSTGHQNMTAGV